MKRALVCLLSLCMAFSLMSCKKEKEVIVEGPVAREQTQESEAEQVVAEDGPCLLAIDYEDKVYQINQDGTKVGAYDLSEAKEVFLQNAIPYGDCSFVGILDGVGIFKSMDYSSQNCEGMILYAYSFDNRLVKEIYNEEVYGEFDSIDLYNNRIYIDYNENEKESHHCSVFNLDSQKLSINEDTEEEGTLDAFLQAASGRELRLQTSYYSSYSTLEYNVCSKRMLDKYGFVVAEDYGGIHNDVCTIALDGTKEELDNLNDVNVSVTLYNDKWLYCYGRGSDDTKYYFYNLETKEVSVSDIEIENDYLYILSLDGDTIFYKDSKEIGGEYEHKSKTTYYVLDLNTGKSREIYSYDSVVGVSDLESINSSMKVVDGKIYLVGYIDSAIQWCRLEDGKLVSIDCPIEDINALKYGTVSSAAYVQTCPYCGTALLKNYDEAFALDSSYSEHAAEINAVLATSLQASGESTYMPEDDSECEYHQDEPDMYCETYEYWVKDVQIIDDQYLTVYRTGYWYGGGAHGYPNREQRIFDLKTGEELSVTDFYSGTEDEFKAYVAEKTKQNYEKDNSQYFASSATEAYEQAYESVSFENATIIWGETSATYLFYPYDLGPYAAGFIEIELPYKEFLGTKTLARL